MNELCKLLNIPEDSTKQKIIDTLKQGKDKTKIIEEARKQLDPKQHDIMNPILRRPKNKDENDKNKDVISIALAYQKIREAYILIGGRILFLECEDHPKLTNFYSRNGFSELANYESPNNLCLFLKNLKDI